MKRKFDLVYLYHSNTADFHKHWKDIRESNIPFFRNARNKLKGRKLKGLAIVVEQEHDPFIYTIYGVVEHGNVNRRDSD